MASGQTECFSTKEADVSRRQKAQPPTPDSLLALLVENDGDTRAMYAEWLVFSGLRVAEAATADEAIQKTHRLRPHVITTDIGLAGGSDGCELCARLKADGRTRAIPVIAVTAWAMGGHLERAQRAGCDSVLTKPCSPEKLLAEIRRLLTRSETKKKQQGR
jgi:two-component system, cell cycle response regulator DivK